MFKFIGVRGHRGAGKNTISYLLGDAIEYYVQHNKSFEGYDDEWERCMDRISKDDKFVQEADFQYVYFESFADSLKVMIHTMFNIPTEWMYDDYEKDNVWVNMKNFRYYRRDNETQDKPSPIISQKELFKQRYNEIDSEVRPKIFAEDLWMSLRDLILYVGLTMQNFFGLNTWVKSLSRNQGLLEEFYADKKTIYKIFTDCKFRSETSYILANAGRIVKVTRLDNIKEDSDISNDLDFDDRVDFEVDIKNIRDLKTKIKDIAYEIVEHESLH